jgi:phospholipid/cholesterol/gamma-HCH transport system permease protein
MMKCLPFSAYSPLRLGLEVVLALPQLRRFPVFRVLLKQLYFSGVESIRLIALIGAAMGLVIASQLHLGFGNSSESTMRILSWIVFNELAPLLTAMILIARSSSAMASELAAMQVNHEIRHLEWMGISPTVYLIVPRVVGMTLASSMLTFYFAVFALLSGGLVVAGTHVLDQMILLFADMQMQGMLTGLAKSVLFGASMSVLACSRGMNVSRSFTAIPQAASRSVIHCLLTVFLIEGLFALGGSLL